MKGTNYAGFYADEAKIRKASNEQKQEVKHTFMCPYDSTKPIDLKVGRAKNFTANMCSIVAKCLEVCTNEKCRRVLSGRVSRDAYAHLRRQTIERDNKLNYQHKTK